MCKPEHGRVAVRRGRHYSVNLTGAESALVAPLIPPANHGGRQGSVNVRNVLNAIFYMLSTGCQSTTMPRHQQPKSTVCDYLNLWHSDGPLECIHHTLYVVA